MNAERFWSKVTKGAGCWEWQGSRFDTGYGQFHVDRVPVGAHRIAWLLTSGEIPNGLCVLHHCDNRGCVRPDHLFLGTKGDNARDCAGKGRQHLQVHPENSPTPKAILTEDQVREIRSVYATGPRTAEVREALARKYGVALPTLNSVVYRKTWSHVA